MRARFLLAALAAISLPCAPAIAHEHGMTAGTTVRTYPGHWGGPFGMWYGGWQPQVVVNVPNPPMQQPQQWQNGGYANQTYEGQNLDRDSWLRECRRRLGDNGVGGAVIGGVVGGVAGNVIAGRGNRVLGTVAGAAVGAVAGAVIDKAEDRTRVQDRCEAMLAGPSAQSYGYANGYAVPVMMVPVMMVPMTQPAQPMAERPYKETVVTEEYWVDAPRRSRHIPPRRAAHGKRVRLMPDKRVPN